MTRKPKPIKERREVDDDLRELVEVLDEHRLDHNAMGWFTLPWRHGYNAASVAYACFTRNVDTYASKREKHIESFLHGVLATPTTATEVDYERAAMMLERVDTDEVSSYLRASLRCLQIWLSNSSGGGHAYNSVLMVPVERSLIPIGLIEDVVLEWRCRDAIGTTAVMQSDRHDRARRAFTIAWKRGLFHAAYSIAPIAS